MTITNLLSLGAMQQSVANSSLNSSSLSSSNSAQSSTSTQSTTETSTETSVRQSAKAEFGVTNRAAVAYQWKNYLNQSSQSGTSSSKTDYTPETASEAMAQGIPTHSFFYYDIDSLAQTAADDTQTLDTSFAEDILDFFTAGNYTSQDVDTLQGELTTALQEMAQQLADTGKVNANALESRMTIGGTEVSLGELADFQMMGQKLAPAFDGITEDSSRFEDMQSMAKMAVARLTGRVYGQDKGEIGAMFSSAIDQLYEAGVDRINQLYTDAQDSASNSSLLTSTAQNREDVSNMFSQLSTTNKSAMAYDFNQKLSTMTSLLNQQYSQFGTPTAYRNASEAAKNVGQYFSALYQLL